MKFKFLPKFAKFGAFALIVTAAMAGSYIYRGVSPVTEAVATTNMSAAPNETLQKPVIALPDFEKIAAQQGGGEYKRVGYGQNRPFRVSGFSANGSERSVLSILPPLPDARTARKRAYPWSRFRFHRKS